MQLESETLKVRATGKRDTRPQNPIWQTPFLIYKNLYADKHTHILAYLLLKTPASDFT